jgi:hypothetical protein
MHRTPGPVWQRSSSRGRPADAPHRRRIRRYCRRSPIAAVDRLPRSSRRRSPLCRRRIGETLWRSISRSCSVMIAGRSPPVDPTPPPGSDTPRRHFATGRAGMRPSRTSIGSSPSSPSSWKPGRQPRTSLWPAIGAHPIPIPILSQRPILSPRPILRPIPIPIPIPILSLGPILSLRRDSPVMPHQPDSARPFDGSLSSGLRSACLEQRWQRACPSGVRAQRHCPAER